MDNYISWHMRIENYDKNNRYKETSTSRNAYHGETRQLIRISNQLTGLDVN